jgi:hypothetical protein
MGKLETINKQVSNRTQLSAHISCDLFTHYNSHFQYSNVGSNVSVSHFCHDTEPDCHNYLKYKVLTLHVRNIFQSQLDHGSIK